MTYNVEIDLVSGQILEHFGVSEQNVNDLKMAFHHSLNQVFTIIDRDGKSHFRMKDVTAICINEEKELNKAGF